MYKNIALIFLFLLCSWIQWNTFVTHACEYQSQIQQCIDSESPRTIEEFLCIEWPAEQKAYQVILDQRFNEIDEEIETYLEGLEQAKSKYFWHSRTEHHVDGILEIHNRFAPHGDYASRYQAICWVELIAETQLCLWGDVSINASVDFFRSSTCGSLIETKLNIYKQVAYDILYLNKSDIRSDESLLFTTQERTQYDTLIDLFNINLGYIERMLQKWPSKIYNVH